MVVKCSEVNTKQDKIKQASKQTKNSQCNNKLQRKKDNNSDLIKSGLV